MKYTLKNIAQNCRKATWLMEKKQAGSITMREKLELKVHLAACSACRMFAQQSILINKLARELFFKPQGTGGVILADDAKKKMQDQIIDKMKKN